MGTTAPSLFVSVLNDAAWIRVAGRATFSCSVPFKTLIHELQQRRYRKFILDLAECQTMDSTFLGVLAGLALRWSEEPMDGHATLSLVNPNSRILDLLDNLGVAHLFSVCHLDGERAARVQTPVEAAPASKEELSRTCLEAHQLLMAINPENVPRFKEVTQFLAEDLKKLGELGANGRPEGSSAGRNS